jgi:sigma-B regulation protein RsbU (phosphoserine phosphatase)
LGILDSIDHSEGESSAQLGIGDRIVLFTDGVTEAMSPERQLFGEPALDRVLSQCGHDPDGIVRGVTQALKAHRRGAEPNDDVCVMVIGRDAIEPRSTA